VVVRSSFGEQKKKWPSEKHSGIEDSCGKNEKRNLDNIM
jgi:hypothetical protein